MNNFFSFFKSEYYKRCKECFKDINECKCFNSISFLYCSSNCIIDDGTNSTLLFISNFKFLKEILNLNENEIKNKLFQKNNNSNTSSSGTSSSNDENKFEFKFEKKFENFNSQKSFDSTTNTNSTNNTNANNKWIEIKIKNSILNGKKEFEFYCDLNLENNFLSLKLIEPLNLKKECKYLINKLKK